jgi:hypothetical protein
MKSIHEQHLDLAGMIGKTVEVEGMGPMLVKSIKVDTTGVLQQYTITGYGIPSGDAVTGALLGGWTHVKAAETAEHTREGSMAHTAEASRSKRIEGAKREE